MSLGNIRSKSSPTSIEVGKALNQQGMPDRTVHQPVLK